MNTIVLHAGRRRTGYPWNFNQTEFADAQRMRETKDLLREVECAQWLALESSDRRDGTRDYLDLQIPEMLSELERRKRLWREHPGDPLRPDWPNPAGANLRSRIDAIHTAWPIDRFCRELLACGLIKVSDSRFKSRCPLPGHSDRTPSFSIDVTKGLAYCHGCQRGGDVLKLTQYMLNLDRFMDALTALEREGGA